MLFAVPSFALAKINIVTTTSDLAAIAREVGGNLIEVTSIAKGYQDPHFVEAKPSYLLKLRKADLFIQVGLELEVGWAPPLLQNARNPKVLPGNRGFLDASSGCDILEKGKVADRSQGDVHPLGNPHYWLDPANGRIIAQTIARRLAELDPANAASYRDNLTRFEAHLTKKEKEWAQHAAKIKGTKVVTYHNSWPNFVKHFGIEVVNFIEPKPGIPPPPAHIRALIGQIRAEKIRSILVEPYFDLKLPEKIARESGAKVLVFAPSVGSHDEIKTYTDLFDHNLKLLLENKNGDL